MIEGLFQPLHLVMILIIVLVIFGPGKLPQIGAGLGKSIREFKKAISDMEKPQVEEKPVGDKTEGASSEERKSL